MMDRDQALEHVLSVCLYSPITGDVVTDDSAVKFRSAYPYSMVFYAGRSFRKHRIAVLLMGFDLADSDDVHHINFSESDDRWSNLLILSRSAHKAPHADLQGRADYLQLSRCGCLSSQRFECVDCSKARERCSWKRRYRSFR